jgi:hypothetical protein
VAVLAIEVPDGTWLATRTTRVKLCTPSSAVRLARVHDSGAVDPAAWGAQAQPAGAEVETNVVPEGRASVSVTPDAVLPATVFATPIE